MVARQAVDLETGGFDVDGCFDLRVS